MDEATLLAQYRPWLRALASRMTSPDRVEDLAQEGWIALWRALGTHEPERAPLDWWLKRKAHAGMLDVLRTWSRTGLLAGRAPRVTAVESTDPAELPEHDYVIDALELAYHEGQFTLALAGLTPREREYVLLRFWGDYRGKELIEHFGYWPNGLWRTARPKLALALAHLRTCVS